MPGIIKDKLCKDEEKLVEEEKDRIKAELDKVLQQERDEAYANADSAKDQCFDYYEDTQCYATINNHPCAKLYYAMKDKAEKRYEHKFDEMVERIDKNTSIDELFVKLMCAI